MLLQVQCANNSSLWYWHNSCLNQSQMCDHYVDCQDRSDEMDCNHLDNSTSGQPQPLCPSNYFPCGYLNSTLGPLCVKQNKRCNGEQDCLNGADEQGCKTMCPPHRTTCLNGTEISTGLRCIVLERRCDGAQDCTDGSDELLCSTPPLS